MKCVRAGSLSGTGWHSIRAGNERPRDCYCGCAEIDDMGEGAGLERGLDQVCLGCFEFSSH